MSNWTPMQQDMPQGQSKQQKNRRKKGGLLSALCRFLGTVMLAALIAACIPLTVPKLMGWQVYTVESGSMEPELPVGTLVLIRPADPSEIMASDIISYTSGNAVVTHRVVENKVLEGRFITKGDANAEVDMEPVSYNSFLGRLAFQSVLLGQLLFIVSTTVGKVYVFLFAACGVMFHLLAGLLRRG